MSKIQLSIKGRVLSILSSSLNDSKERKTFRLSPVFPGFRKPSSERIDIAETDYLTTLIAWISFDALLESALRGDFLIATALARVCLAAALTAHEGQHGRPEKRHPTTRFS